MLLQHFQQMHGNYLTYLSFYSNRGASASIIDISRTSSDISRSRSTDIVWAAATIKDVEPLR